MGRLLTRPGNIVIDPRNMKPLDRASGPSGKELEPVLKDLFGDKYVMEMKPTMFITRLVRMKKEVQRGQESLGRKLGYLLWLN